MEKKALSEKEKYLTILLCVVGTALALYIGICHYMGLFGKMEYFQHQLVIAAGSEVLFCTRWFLHSVFAGFLLVFCIYGIYRIKIKKKRYGMLILWLFLSWWLNLLFTPGSAMVWIMTVIIGGMFAFANVPSMIGRAVTRNLVFKAGDLEKKSGRIMQTETETSGMDLLFSSEKDTGCRCMAVLSVCGFRRNCYIFAGTKTGRYIVHYFVSFDCSFYSQESTELRFDTIWLYPCS